MPNTTTDITQATDALRTLFWAHVKRIADDDPALERDAFAILRRATLELFKSLKPTHGVDVVDDGREALWRVRLQIWRREQELTADTDPTRRPEDDGATLIQGLPRVALWASELIKMAHPTANIAGASEDALIAKIRSLRVALSNGDGEALWRIRYTVTPNASDQPAPTPGSLRGLAGRSAEPEHYLATVKVTRESAQRVPA